MLSGVPKLHHLLWPLFCFHVQTATIVECQGDIERTLLDIDSTKAEREVLVEEQARMSALLDERNAVITRIEAEIIKRNVTIERKQSQIDQINKKIDRILTERGGVSGAEAAYYLPSIVCCW